MSELDFEYELNALIKTVCPGSEIKFHSEFLEPFIGEKADLNLFIKLNPSSIDLSLSAAGNLVDAHSDVSFLSVSSLGESDKAEICEESCVQASDNDIHDRDSDKESVLWHKNPKDETGGRKKNPYRLEYKNVLKRMVMKALTELPDSFRPDGMLFRKPVWGTMTGVRPSKIALNLLEGKFSFDELDLDDESLRSSVKERVVSELKSEYLCSDDRARLSTDIAFREKEILNKLGNDRVEDSFSLYAGIPFCPTTCLYCSFTSYPLKAYSQYIDAYLDAIEFEMEKKAKEFGCNPLTIYVGGGTPTSLNHKQLDRFLGMIDKNFNVAGAIEYTVEAGRPDTLDLEKLQILKEHKVDRVSINPQSMQLKTLEKIGRFHTPEDIVKCFEMARKAGIQNINADLIAGLPGEDVLDFSDTVDKVLSLNPESVTVHSLVIKRASRMREVLDRELQINEESRENDIKRLKRADLLDEMIKFSNNSIVKFGLKPYYMYRQKNANVHYQSSGQENIGYSKEGFECLYNILMMEEKQSIVSVGAGASTKLYDKETKTVSRVENVKSLKDYIDRNRR